MKRRMVYPDVLRALSSIVTVLFSTCMAAGCTGAAGLMTWVCPMFIMLSGMFFLDSGWYISPREMAKKYVLRVVAAYVVWWVLALLVNQYTDGVLQGILTGSTFYLNFLFIVLALYIISPILRVFTRAVQPRELAYAVLVTVLIGCGYSFVQMQLGSARLVDYALMGFGYVGVFLAGWYFRTAFLSRRQLRWMYFLGAACLILALRGVVLHTTTFAGDPASLLVSPDAVLIAMALFLVVKNTLSKMRLSARVLRPISRLSQLSFGIYLIHPLLLALLCRLMNTYGLILPTPVFVIVGTALLVLASGVLTWLIRKIPKIGGYIA